MSCCVCVWKIGFILFFLGVFFHIFFFFRRRRCWQQLWQLSPRWCRDRCPSSVSPRYASSRATPTNNKNRTEASTAKCMSWQDASLYLRRFSFAALFRGGRCNSAWSVSPLLCGARWIRAHSAALPAGSQLSCTRGEGGGRAEEAAWRVTNLNNSWRQKGQVSALCFSYTVRVGCAWWWRWWWKVSFSFSDVLLNAVTEKSRRSCYSFFFFS